MRSSKSRSRNKSNRQRTLVNVVNRVFDSSGPEGKVRGTPQQIIDKYLTLARDAQLSNDRVAEQSFLQHAEHYTRMLGEAQREQAERQAQHQSNNPNQRGPGDDDRENGRGGYQNQPRGEQQQDGESVEDGDDRQPYRAAPAPREQRAPREPQRDHQRDFSRDDQRASRDPQRDDPRDVPRDDPRDRSRAEIVQERGLPDAVSASDDADTGLVETPESQPKPKRAARAPRVDSRAEAADEGSARASAPRRRRSPAKPDTAAAPETAQDQ